MLPRLVAFTFTAAALTLSSSLQAQEPAAGATAPAQNRPETRSRLPSRPDDSRTIVIDAEEALGRASNMPDNRIPGPPGLGSALEASMPASVQVSGRDTAAATPTLPRVSR